MEQVDCRLCKQPTRGPGIGRSNHDPMHCRVNAEKASSHPSVTVRTAWRPCWTGGRRQEDRLRDGRTVRRSNDEDGIMMAGVAEVTGTASIQRCASAISRRTRSSYGSSEPAVPRKMDVGMAHQVEPRAYSVPGWGGTAPRDCSDHGCGMVFCRQAETAAHTGRSHNREMKAEVKTKNWPVARAGGAGG